jgi:hypothetical protein
MSWSAFGPRLLQSVFPQTPDSAHAILPTDLLSLSVSTTRIADPDFVDTQVPLCDLDSDFRLEPKAIFLEVNGLDDFSPECLIASLHVTQT